MKILVTGSSGFLGSHTVEFFRNLNHNVTGIDIVPGTYTDIVGDVKNQLPDEFYDAVFHFAAFVGGRKGIDHNTWKILENIELDRITLKWSEDHCGKIIYPSSSAAYPASLQMDQVAAMKESDIDSGPPFDAYGLSKRVAEQMLAYCKTPSHIMRPFSIYGPGQDLDYPIPNIIKNARMGKSIVWGSGKHTRDWVYIDDALKVFDYLMHCDTPTVMNIGSGEPVEFIKVAEIIYKELHGFTIPVQTDTTEPEGVKHRYADTTYQNSLDLGTVVTLEEGIRKVIYA